LAGVATHSPSLVVVLADPADWRSQFDPRVAGEDASRVRCEGRRPRHLLRLGFLIGERLKVAVTKKKPAPGRVMNAVALLAVAVLSEPSNDPVKPTPSGETARDLHPSTLVLAERRESDVGEGLYALCLGVSSPRDLLHRLAVNPRAERQLGWASQRRPRIHRRDLRWLSTWLSSDFECRLSSPLEVLEELTVVATPIAFENAAAFGAEA
jgi:hypothetical protein